MLVFASENELFESSRSNIREVAGGREISMRTDHIHVVLSCYDMQNITCGCVLSLMPKDGLCQRISCLQIKAASM